VIVQAGFYKLKYITLSEIKKKAVPETAISPIWLKIPYLESKPSLYGG